MRTLALLLGQRLRRDWLQLTMWIGGTVLLALATYSGVSSSYGTLQDRQGLLLTVLANPVVMMFRGLPSGDDTNAVMLFLIFPFLAMMAAFMSTFLAVRHTRAEEESGRAELVDAASGNRRAALWATLIHGLLANLVLGVLTALTFLALGMPATGSWVSGLTTGAVGITFLSIGLAAAQVMPTSRAANSTAVWLVMLTFVLAGYGNAIGTQDLEQLRVTSSWLTWLSPFGWGENARPFADNSWLPLLLCLAVAAVVVGLAWMLQTGRDVGASWLPERVGRASARPRLNGPTALVWRLSAGSIVGWAVGGLLTGMLATAIASAVQQFASNLPTLEQIFQQLSQNGGLQLGSLVLFFTMLGVLAAASAVQVISKARQEEVHGTAELVLAAPVGRLRWLGGYALVGLASIVITVAAAVLGAVFGLLTQSQPDWSLAGDSALIGLGQVLAASVFLAVAALVFVFAPRWTIGLGWTLLLAGLSIGLFGPMFGAPQWLVNLAPIASAPTVTSAGFDLKSGIWLLLAVLVAGGVAAWGMRRRELASE